MSEQETIAVIGAGAIGTAAAFALAREGRRVLLLDRDEPGVAGASFGNAGHIAQESVRPLPSPGLLFGFYRELFRFGGTLDLSPRQALRMSAWIRRFAAAAFRRSAKTPNTWRAALVRPAVAAWARACSRRSAGLSCSIGMDTTRLPWGSAAMRACARMRMKWRKSASRLARSRPNKLLPLQRGANAAMAAGLWFEDSANVIDPLEAVRAFAAAAMQCGSTFRRLDVKGLRPRGGKIEIVSDQTTLVVDGALVCAGVHSAPLLAPFGLHAPLQAVRGYNIEIPGGAAFFDAPVVYADEHVIVTPMSGRLRATSYMEFADADAPADARKPARLRRTVHALGYGCELDGSSWVGSRPVLPDYLPGIGRAPGPANLFYAIGHQHIGLTLAPITAELVADIVAKRAPRIPVAAYDLQRF